MFGSSILDVAIGLTAVYFMLSLIAKQVNDLIVQILSWRAKDLENGVRKMLTDPALQEQVWQHPNIAGVGKGFHAPEYIQASTFTLAVIDAIVPPSTGGSSITPVSLSLSQ